MDLFLYEWPSEYVKTKVSINSIDETLDAIRYSSFSRNNKRGDAMFSYIYRLIRDFEKEHGIHPNLLYLNETHAHYLKDGFADSYTYQSIRDFLQMELIISREIMHPHVAWSQAVNRKAV